MTLQDAYRLFLAVVADQPFLARLFVSSLELALLAPLAAGAIRLARIRSARLASCLWLLVLAKPIASLAFGAPFRIALLAAPSLPAPGPIENPAVVISESPVAQATRQEDETETDSTAAAPGSGTSDRIAHAADDAMAATARPRAVVDRNGSGPTSGMGSAAFARIPQAGSIALALWGAGAAFFLGLSLTDRVRRRRLIAAGQLPGPELARRYSELGGTWHVTRLPQLLVTDRLESPALVGMLRPVILLPDWLEGAGDRAPIDWALRHEVMHWRHHDPAAACVRELAQILFYFHPAVWWAGRKWEEAAEFACDRAIVAGEAESLVYAEQLHAMLAVIHGRRRMALRTGLFATRTQIGRRVAALLEGALESPARLSALMIVAVVLLSAVTLSVGVAFSDRANAPATDATTDESQQNEQVASTGAAPAQADGAGVLTGRVTDPAGNPVRDARIHVALAEDAGRGRTEKPSVLTARSSADGSFRVALPKPSSADPKPAETPAPVVDAVIAVKEGFGPAWKLRGDLSPDKDIALTLAVDDLPIVGRLIDPEGKPHAGARVSVIRLGAPREGDLGPWLEAVKNGESYRLAATRLFAILPAFGADAVPPIVTDADGRFRIAGLGRERYATLTVVGPGTAYAEMSVVTRRIEPIAASEYNVRPGPAGGANAPMRSLPPGGAAPTPPTGPEGAAPATAPPSSSATTEQTRSRPVEVFSTSMPAGGTMNGNPPPTGNPTVPHPVRGPEFDLLVPRSRPIVGKVRDAGTEMPVAGVRVINRRFAGARLPETPKIEAVTDANGDFRLFGMPEGKGNVIAITPSTDVPYFGQLVEVDVDENLAPRAVDVRLHRGIWITGRVTDKSTGAGVPASVDWHPYFTNEFAQQRVPEFAAREKNHLSGTPTGPDGRFRLVGLPGQAILAAVSTDGDARRYRLGAGAETIETGPASPRMPGGRLPQNTWQQVKGGPLSQRQHHALKPITVPEGQPSFESDLQFDPGETIRARVVDPDGQPLTGYAVRGQSHEETLAGTLSDETVFEIRGLHPAEGRAVYVHHAERNLGKAVLVRIEPNGPREITIELAPCATIKGRIVTRSGQPLAEEMFSISAVSSWGRQTPGSTTGQSAFRRPDLANDGNPGGGAPAGAHRIDADGRFTLTGLPVGCDYSIICRLTLSGGPNGLRRNILQTITDARTVKPGETIDLGDLRLPTGP